MSLESKLPTMEGRMETEETLDPQTIALATSTYYPSYGEGAPDSSDNVRGRLAFEFLKKAAEDGYRVVVVDGASSKYWKEELESLKASLGVVVEQQTEPGLSASRREAMKKAASLPGILVIGESEPEKIDIERQARKLALPIVNGKASVTVPNRGKSGRENYPEAQKKAELRANTLANAIVKNEENIDWWVGVRFIKNDPHILDLFLKKRVMSGKGKLWQTSDPSDWSDAIYTPLVELLKSNPELVQSINIDYAHPIEMTMTEVGNPEFELRRVRQLHSIITNIAEEIRILERKEGKPSRLLEFERLKGEERPIDVLYFDPVHLEWTKSPGDEEIRSQIIDLCRSIASLPPKPPNETLQVLQDKGVSVEFLQRLGQVLRSQNFYSTGQVRVGDDIYVGVLKADSDSRYPEAPFEILLTKIQERTKFEVMGAI